MSRRRRSARERTDRLRVARAKVVRRRARSMTRTATVAAAAVTLAGVGPVVAAAAVPLHRAATSAAPCDPRTPSSRASQFVGVSGKLFFTADDGVHGRELWKSD